MKTFVFTDIVRSVDLKGQMVGSSDAERDAAYINAILTPHREHLEIGLAEAGGRVVSTAGDGHFLVFDNPMLAAGWAIDVQRRHRDRPIATPRDAEVQVRIALHVGFPQTDPDDSHNFVGKAVDYAARLADLATAGQVLASAATLGLLRDGGLDGIGFYSHGDRLLRGIGSVEVHELLYDGDEHRPLRPADPGKATESNDAGAATVDQIAPATDVLPVDDTADPQQQPREWTVLPPTMGLTEFARQKSSAVSNDGSSDSPSGGSSGAAVKHSPARTLGNYELGELLGVGGMGNVYKARHKQFDRTRAIKIIKPHFVETGHEEIIRRFYREIQAIGGLDHPNIVVAIDSSAPDADTHYLVMEYIDGVSSEQLISRRRSLPVADACEIVRQAAVGLEYIHRQGMVHRDIKPSNLMLTDAEASTLSAGADGGETRRPVVKILDLGLALLVTEDQPRFTRFDHGAMGTAMYMSPEQWITTSVDIRSDIYSLGCTLYHLLAGRPPYYDSDLKPQRAHERAPTPSIATLPGAPPELDALLQRMMAKAPSDRFNHPAEVAEAIAPFCGESDLLSLVDRSRHGPSAKTDPRARSETKPTGQGVSDTFGPLPPLPGPMPTVPTAPLSQPAPPPSLLRRLLTPLAISAAIALVLIMGSTIRNQQARLQQEKEDKLLTGAPQSAKELAREISSRFAMLADAANSAKLQRTMRAVVSNAKPPPPETERKPATKEQRQLWQPLQEWLAMQRVEASEQSNLISSSWFITDHHGRQVARHPPGATIGRWYHDRDYFHGKGTIDLAETPTPTPITARHQSAVYRSSSTKRLKVAFSTPIYDEDRAEVLGVLAMSVNLGDFQVLEDAKRLPDPIEVVLVDMRDDVPEQHGWLLHHRELGDLEDADNPFRLPADLLARVDAAIADDKTDHSLRNPIFRGYPDLLGRTDKGPYVGAFEPVVIRSKDELAPTGWLVIVQEER